MRIVIVSIFPELFGPFLETSLIGRAVARNLLEIDVRQLRDFTDDRHRVVDDVPYGGGPGMVMKAGPWIRAVRELAGPRTWRVLLSPRGVRLDDEKVCELARRPEILLLCGRYEGIDERVRQAVVDEEVSIGDYVLSGGEVAAMVVIEAVSREIPGVVGASESVTRESFRTGLLDYPQYTRPARVEGLTVPDVLRSGNHAAIESWRLEQALRTTRHLRPDLLAASVSASEENPDGDADITGQVGSGDTLIQRPKRDKLKG